MVARTRIALAAALAFVIAAGGWWFGSLEADTRSAEERTPTALEDDPTATDASARTVPEPVEPAPALVRKAAQLDVVRAAASAHTGSGAAALPEDFGLVSGVVYGEDGARAQAGVLEVHYPDTEHSTPTRVSLSSGGTFDVQVERGQWAVLTAVLPRGVTDRCSVTLQRGDPPQHVELHGRGSWTLEGRLVDLLGRPLRGFMLAIDGESSNRVTTDHEGLFTFADLDERPTLLETRMDEFVALDTQEAAIVWTFPTGRLLGEAPDRPWVLPLVQLVVNARHPDGSSRALRSSGWRPGALETLVEITARDGSGWVRWLGEESRAPSFPWRDEGGLLFHLVEAGHTYRVALEGWSHLPAARDVHVPAGGGDVYVEFDELVPIETVSVELVAVDAAGEPLPAPMEWSLRGGVAKSRAAVPVRNETGASITVDLVPGEYSAQASKPFDEFAVMYLNDAEQPPLAMGSLEFGVGPVEGQRFQVVIQEVDADEFMALRQSFWEGR